MAANFFLACGALKGREVPLSFACGGPRGRAVFGCLFCSVVSLSRCAAVRVCRKRFSPEQRVFLVELFEWPEGRLTEEQLVQKFKDRFAAHDGAYARSLRLDRAQIKAWLSCEKRRRDAAASSGGAAGTGAGVED